MLTKPLAFARSALAVHLLRGLLAFALMGLSAALLSRPADAWQAGLALPLAAVLLRGCPMCWALDLVATARARVVGGAGQ